MAEQLNDDLEFDLPTDEETVGTFVSEELDPNREKFILDADEFTLTVNPYPQLKNPVITKHTVGRPTFEQEVVRERATPIVVAEAGKVNGEQGSSTFLEDERANVNLYNKIVTRVFGYPRNFGEAAPEDGLDPQEEVTINRRGDRKKAVDSIPERHKSLVINGMYPYFMEMHEVDEDAQVNPFGGNEWTLKHEIGGKEELEDGTLSPPEFTLLWTFEEPTTADWKKFRGAFPSVQFTDRKTGRRREQRTSNLKIMAEIFDRLLVGVEGAILQDGSEVDVRNADHLRKIPGAFKKGAMIRLFSFLQADLGN